MFKLALSGYVDEHVDAICLTVSCQQVPVYRGASAPLLRTYVNRCPCIAERALPCCERISTGARVSRSELSATSNVCQQVPVYRGVSAPLLRTYMYINRCPWIERSATANVCQQVPVYRGASAPLLRTPAAGGGAELHHGADGLGDAHFSDAPDTSIVKEEHAANAICRPAREYKRV